MQPSLKVSNYILMSEHYCSVRLCWQKELCG